MFLLFASWLLEVLQFVGCTLEESSDTPRTCKCKLELVNHLLIFNQTNCASCKNNVTNGIDARVRVARIDVFTVVCTLFLDKQLGNFMASRQPLG